MRQSSNSSSRLTRDKVTTTTMQHTEKSTSTPAVSVNKSLRVEPGDEAFWALEWVRRKLKKRVTNAKQNLLRVQRTSKSWTKKSLPTIFTRAAMVYLPALSAIRDDTVEKQGPDSIENLGWLEFRLENSLNFGFSFRKRRKKAQNFDMSQYQNGFFQSIWVPVLA